jgi:hypothetical protein
MKPYLHAKVSVKKHGGKMEDYLAIHEFFDSSKIAVADIRHRAMLHSAWGIYLLEKVFGSLITNSDGKQVSVRDLGEEHVLDDLGFIPTMQDWLEKMPIEPWMSGTRKKRRVATFATQDETFIGAD